MLTDWLTKLPLFFASTTVVPGGDGGTAEEVADTGGGGDDTGGTEDSGRTEPGGEEAGADDAESAELSGETEESEQHADRDGRTLPQHVKQALAKLKETDPKAADIARKAYYEAGDFKRVFPNVQEARDARDTLEGLGGQEGIQTLQKEVSDYAAELTAMSKGDASVIENLAKDFPQALPKLTTAAIAKLQAVNPAAYEHMAGGVTSRVLRDAEVFDSVRRLTELIGDGKQPQALELAKQLGQWMRELDQFSKTKLARQEGEESDEAKQLSERQAELDRREATTFRGQVAKSVIDEMNTAIGKALAPMLKSKKLTPQQRQGLINGARSHLASQFEKDAGYQRRMRSLLDQGDQQAIVRYLRGQLDAERVGRSVRAEWGSRGFASPIKAVGGGGGASASVNGNKPTPDLVDWSKDLSRARFIGNGVTGEYTRKSDQKVVKFKH